MSTISSQLICQIAPLHLVKNMLGLAQKLGYEPELNQLNYEGWYVGLRLVVRRAYDGVRAFKGFSTIISWRDIAKAYERYLSEKSSSLTIDIIKKNVFHVSSSQDPKTKHLVYAHPTGLTCGCMKFKCLRNRQSEAPVFFNNLNKFKLEVFNTETLSEETVNAPICHHILAVMKAVFGASSLSEYVENYNGVISSIHAMLQARLDEFSGSPPPPRRNPYS